MSSTVQLHAYCVYSTRLSPSPPSWNHESTLQHSTAQHLLPSPWPSACPSGHGMPKQSNECLWVSQLCSGSNIGVRSANPAAESSTEYRVQRSTLPSQLILDFNTERSRVAPVSKMTQIRSTISRTTYIALQLMLPSVLSVMQVQLLRQKFPLSLPKYHLELYDMPSSICHNF